MRVSDKRTMYRMLDAGRFGNTIPRWYSLANWEASGYKSDLWAIRSMLAGDWKRSGLNFNSEMLRMLYQNWHPNGGGEISPMVDHMIIARFQVYESERGLYVWAVEGMKDVPWRVAFADHSRHLEGVAARTILRRYLNENSYNDLQEVLGEFDGHVVELTALDRCHGLSPHRNAVVWEVRDY